ncbi:MAG: hypothetical protein Q8K75_03035 [Chlamydiales bacterium]|nr:hypothetical protein [Chlamydiales bacterium]
MKKYITLMLVVLITSISPSLHAREIKPTTDFSDYSRPTAQQLEAYYEQLQDQLEKSADRVTKIKNQIADPDKISPSAHIEFQLAIEMLQAKTELVSNLIGTESLRSPQVRYALLELLTLNEITEANIVEFQALINTEKLKIAEYDREQVRRMQKEEVKRGKKDGDKTPDVKPATPES